MKFIIIQHSCYKRRIFKEGCKLGGGITDNFRFSKFRHFIWHYPYFRTNNVNTAQHIKDIKAKFKSKQGIYLRKREFLTVGCINFGYFKITLSFNASQFFDQCTNSEWKVSRGSVRNLFSYDINTDCYYHFCTYLLLFFNRMSLSPKKRRRTECSTEKQDFLASLLRVGKLTEVKPMQVGTDFDLGPLVRDIDASVNSAKTGKIEDTLEHRKEQLRKAREKATSIAEDAGVDISGSLSLFAV
jgi:hypothetical protein